MNNFPTVSIIIPNYNRGIMLAEAVESCLDQKNVRVEVIVVDDGSTDGSPDLLSEKFPMVKIFKQHHRGACAARNRGIQEATGQFIKFLDSDDKLVPDILSEQIECFKNFKADVVYGDFEMFGNLKDPRVGGKPYRVTGQVDNAVNALLGDWWCAPFCYLYKKEAIAKQFWDEDLECLQDFDFILQFALRGKKFVYHKGVVGYYRIHEGQITGSSAYRYAVNRCKILHNVLKEYPELTNKQKFLIAQGFWTAARIFYRTDLIKFYETGALIRNLSPGFYPKLWEPLPVRMLTGILGIENAEKVLGFRRYILNRFR